MSELKTNRPRIDQAADDLVDYIVQRELKPGDKLPPEHELTELLSVGRSTLREAVRMLASRNVLEVRHGSGSYISEKSGVSDDPFGFAFIPDKKKLAEDLVDFRMMIEPRTAAAAAARDITDDEKRDLRAQCKKVESLILAGRTYSEEDSRLHTMIATLSQNCIVPKLMPIITHSIDLFIDLTGAALAEETILTHRAVVEAICAGNAIEAGDAMTLHLIYNRSQLRKDRSEIK